VRPTPARPALAPSTIATGTWSVVLHGRDEATVNVNIFTNGKHHVSFGGRYAQGSAGPAETFAVEIPTAASLVPLRVSLEGQTFTYRIEGYEAFDRCATA
jgi:hypothetical protein